MFSKHNVFLLFLALTACGDKPEDTGPEPAVDADGDGYTATIDCDDHDATVHPGATELCDELDNDCDGFVDGQDPSLEGGSDWYRDRDADGWGSDDDTMHACEQPAGHVPEAGDCDDDDGAVNPAAEELCNGIDDDCDGLTDHDDEDLGDGEAWYQDADGDGFGDPAVSDAFCSQPAGWVADSSDCDDSEAGVHPGAAEHCNGRDDDCDGLVDSEDPDTTGTATWYQDSDGDGWGDSAERVEACDQPSGHVLDGGDCDDDDASVYPHAEEICDEQDNDCDALVDGQDPELVGGSDWYRDADGDGFGDASDSYHGCSQISGYVADATDCDDSEAYVNPEALEICDGLDDDCDGLIDGQDDDLVDGSTWYRDGDGDGYGGSTSTLVACEQPTGFAGDDSDCDDGDATVNPGADEVCDSIDNDCDGLTDGQDGDLLDGSAWYRDADGDGVGDSTTTLEACSQPSGYVAACCDCDDGDAGVTSCATNSDDGSICAGLMGTDDGLVPTWTGVCDSSLGYASYGGHCYYAVRTSIIWADARASCLAAGGYLVTVQDVGEDAFVQSISTRPWMGACDADTEDTWTWVTGEPWTWENWGSGEPNDSSPGEDCGEVTSFGWNDLWCTHTSYGSGYVCEFDAGSEPPTDTGGPEDTATPEDTAEPTDTATPSGLGTIDDPALDCAAILAADPSAATGSYWLDPDGDGSAVEVTCDMDQEGGGWTVLADLDFSSDPCPGTWVQHSSEGLCYGNLGSSGERSASFDALGITWSEVLVEACMRQYRTDDAFRSSGTLEDVYLDGMSLTWGASGSRQHLYSWAIGHQQTTSAYSCPSAGGTPAPSFIGSDWSCESGNPSGTPGSIWYTPRLFEGERHHLVLSSPTTEDLEGRIMFDQPTSDEDIGVCAFWLAVR